MEKITLQPGIRPAERARQIDKEEFEAECAAVRQRAYAYAAKRRAEARAAITHSLGREIPVQSFNAKLQPWTYSKPLAFLRPAVMHTAFGKTQSLAEWANEYGINIGTVRTRLKLGWTLENALTRTVQEHRRPGVVSDLQASKGTGAGGTVQEGRNITFSGNEV